MGARAEAYANQLDVLSRQLVAAIESYAPAQLQATCEGEQCTAAALASHVALGHPIIADWVATAAAGKPLPSVTMDDVNAMNAEQFARDANRSKEEILTDLRENGAAAADLVRGFDDADLDRSQYFTLVDREVTTEWLIQSILLNEVVQHGASIRAACGHPASA